MTAAQVKALTRPIEERLDELHGRSKVTGKTTNSNHLLSEKLEKTAVSRGQTTENDMISYHGIERATRLLDFPILQLEYSIQQ